MSGALCFFGRALRHRSGQALSPPSKAGVDGAAFVRAKSIGVSAHSRDDPSRMPKRGVPWRSAPELDMPCLTKTWRDRASQTLTQAKTRNITLSECRGGLCRGDAVSFIRLSHTRIAESR